MANASYSGYHRPDLDGIKFDDYQSHHGGHSSHSFRAYNGPPQHIHQYLPFVMGGYPSLLVVEPMGGSPQSIHLKCIVILMGGLVIVTFNMGGSLILLIGFLLWFILLIGFLLWFMVVLPCRLMLAHRLCGFIMY